MLQAVQRDHEKLSAELAEWRAKAHSTASATAFHQAAPAAPSAADQPHLSCFQAQASAGGPCGSGAAAVDESCRSTEEQAAAAAASDDHIEQRLVSRSCRQIEIAREFRTGPAGGLSSKAHEGCHYPATNAVTKISAADGTLELVTSEGSTGVGEAVPAGQRQQESDTQDMQKEGAGRVAWIVKSSSSQDAWLERLQATVEQQEVSW